MDRELVLDNGRYRTTSVLGEGAQGVTFAAVEVETQKPVAIKRFDVRGARSWKEVELAEREVRVLSKLDHPLLPRYVAHFEEDGALYLVMERVEGETLDAMRQREGALSEREVRRFLASADHALTYLHGRSSPVVHRDIKPRNVVRRPDGSYVLVDFGAVSELLSRRGSSTVVGTLGYMAPEQFQGRTLASTDIYGVGATALAALTGKEPETLPHKGLRLDVRAALAGRASEEMIATLEQMLEPDPDLRAKSVGAALEGLSTAATPRVASSSVPAPLVATRRAEDDAVKSTRKLLWTLWGIGWAIVPLSLRLIGAPGLFVPLVMFGSLALLLVLTWHKGALIRLALRKFGLSQPLDTTPAVAAPPRAAPRVAMDAEPSRVRVGSSNLRWEETVGDTAVASAPEKAAHRK